MNSYFFQSALLPTGWQQRVRVTVTDGRFSQVAVDAEPQPGDQHLGVVIPAMPNGHSHVFQRAMAGLAEHRSNAAAAGQDSFWTWRERMYQLANELDHERLYEVAKACYQEMREAGYAAVCEFHYLHRRLDDPSDYLSHSLALLRAAAEVGLPITLLPVLYAFSGVGDQALNPMQQRFGLSVEEYLDLHDQVRPKLQAEQRLGICFHSIRAVNQQQMAAVIKALPVDAPIHIHIAEQQAEIDQALAHYGQRPVAWLMDHFAVDHRWNLVHATHLDDNEIQQITDSGAVAVLCPLTEANLGDGIFPMPAFRQRQGVWAIGSDSHVEIQPQQELKMLEYSQRLQQQQRNVCCSPAQPHVGTWQWLQAIKGGNQACGDEVAGIQAGALSGVVELLGHDPAAAAEQQLDSWIFSDRATIRSLRL